MPLLARQVFGGEDEREVVGRAAAEDVLGLLPEEGPGQKLRVVRADERRAGADAAGDVRPVGAVEAVGRRQRARADARGERGGVRAGVTAQDEVERAL